MEIMGVELEAWLALAVAITALALWGMKRYQKVMEDGSVSLSEVIQTVEESEALIDEVVEKAEDVVRLKKDGTPDLRFKNNSE